MAENLAECTVCHLLIRSVAYGTTICDHCIPLVIERAESQEILDRQRERRYTR
jgi:hypothetical protein